MGGSTGVAVVRMEKSQRISEQNQEDMDFFKSIFIEQFNTETRSMSGPEKHVGSLDWGSTQGWRLCHLPPEVICSPGVLGHPEALIFPGSCGKWTTQEIQWTREWLKESRFNPIPIKLPMAGLPWWRSGWESACQCRGHGFKPWSWKIPHTAEQLSPWATTTEPTCHNYCSLCA